MITAVVISFNRRDGLRRCLDGLYAQQGGLPFEILVVDQGSTDGALEMVRAEAAARPGLLRLELLPDPSLNAKRNRGLEKARHDRVAFIDDDAVPDPGWLAALSAAFDRGDAALVTGAVLPLGSGYRSTVRDSPRPRLWQNRFLDKLVVWRCGCGTNMAVSRARATRIGLFDPAVGAGTPMGCGGDEIDFFLRALDAGLAIRYEPAAMVRHPPPADAAAYERKSWNYYFGIAALLRMKYAAHPVARPMIALRLAHSAARLALHALTGRRALARADRAALRGTWRGWFQGPLTRP